MPHLERLNAVLALAPAIMYAVVLGFLVTTHERWYLWLLIWLLISGASNPLLKRTFAHTAPRISDRPSVCGTLYGDTPCRSCKIFMFRGVTRTRVGTGMPSGHVQTIATALGYMVTSFGSEGNALVLIGVGLLLVVVAQQRVASKCHTALQTVVGGALGFLIGAIGGALVHGRFGLALSQY